MFCKQTKTGFSLIELLVAISFISVIIVLILTMNSFNASLWKLNADKTKAYFFASESLEAIKLLDWSELSSGDYHLAIVNDTWDLLPGSELLADKYTRNINIANVQRASRDNGQVYGEIVESGFVDPDSKKITVTVTWLDKNANPKVFSLENYLNRWQADRFIQSNWLGGSGQSMWLDETKFYTKNSGLETNIEGISTLVSGFLDWNQATPTSTLSLASTYDANDIYLRANLAYMVTENNSSGAEFYIVNVADMKNPSQISSLNIGSSVTAVVVKDDYAYLSTKGDASELRVINISNPASPSIVRTIDLSGTQDALDLNVNETELYILQNEDLHSFSLSDPTNPQLLDMFDLDGLAKEVFVSASTVYVATNNANQELQIIDATNPANLQKVGDFDLAGSLLATDIFVLGTRAYLATDNNSSGAEFFIFDIADLSDPILLGSYEAGAKINAFSIMGPYAVLGLNLSNRELQIIDVSFPATINTVSNFDLSGYILAFAVDCSAIYTATTSNNDELIVIATGVADCGYADSGELESSTFDTGSALVAYNWISWSGSQPANTSIRFQLATSNNSNGPWNFLGPDATAASYYTQAAKEFINYNQHLNQRYFRYKLFLDSQANSQAPILEEVTISYSIYP